MNIFNFFKRLNDMKNHSENEVKSTLPQNTAKKLANLSKQDKAKENPSGKLAGRVPQNTLKKLNRKK